jgi:hypothetical protein
LYHKMFPFSSFNILEQSLEPNNGVEQHIVLQ